MSMANLEEMLDEVPAGKSFLAVMDGTGDTKIVWDPQNTDETDMARKQYDEYVKKGFKAYSVTGKAGDKGEEMRAFDANAARIILVPRQVGG